MYIQAKVKDDESTRVAVKVDLGGTLEKSAELFGASIVHARFIRSAVIEIQGGIRGKTQDQAETWVSDFVMGQSKRRRLTSREKLARTGISQSELRDLLDEMS